MSSYELQPSPAQTEWAVGGALFAAATMVLVGTFQSIVGLAAILNGGFFVVTQHYAFAFDITGWGWIQLILGTFVGIAGLALFAAKPWARVTAMVLAGLAAIANFLFIPYAPVWALAVIALATWVLWSLSRPGVLDATEDLV
jgi:hypothetical protein